jgi:hypothetical protein
MIQKNKKIYKLTLSLLSLVILAYSTVLQFSIPTIVLCFGEDGHIAFEQSELNFSCADSGDHKDHLMDNHNDLSHQDYDCVDIPLIHLLSTPLLEKYGKVKTVKATVVVVYSKIINAYTVSNLDLNKDATIIHSSIKSLQAIILLI